MYTSCALLCTEYSMLECYLSMTFDLEQTRSMINVMYIKSQFDYRLQSTTCSTRNQSNALSDLWTENICS